MDSTFFLIAAIFFALVANGYVLPLVLLFLAVGLAIFGYWHAVSGFDFWAFDEWMRARRDSIGIREWHSPYSAADHFCDPKLVRARNEAAERMNSIMMDQIRSHDREKDRAQPFSGSNGLRQLEYEAAQAKHDENNFALAHDLLRQLAAGDLVTKGLSTKDDTTESERIIPTSRWRVMRFDISKAEAFGPGLHYIGIVIGKKTRR